MEGRTEAILENNNVMDVEMKVDDEFESSENSPNASARHFGCNVYISLLEHLFEQAARSKRIIMISGGKKCCDDFFMSCLKALRRIFYSAKMSFTQLTRIKQFLK